MNLMAVAFDPELLEDVVMGTFFTVGRGSWFVVPAGLD